MYEPTDTEKRDLSYHDWCRSVVEGCGWVLYGSSFGEGCSVFTGSKLSPVEIPEVVLRKLSDKMLFIKELQTIIDSLDKKVS